MAVHGEKKEKFNRIYMGYNPNAFVGPPTNIRDTVVRPVPAPPP